MKETRRLLRIHLLNCSQTTVDFFAHMIDSDKPFLYVFVYVIEHLSDLTYKVRARPIT